MNRCIAFVAFGGEYDKLAASTAKYSRRYTDLPFYVLTNMKARDTVWESVSNVTFKYFPMPHEDNRKIRVSMIKFIPFDEVLYMDADSVIQKPGIENVFNLLKNYDIVCQFYQLFKPKSSLQRKTYGKLAELLGEKFPIERVFAGTFLFKKSDISFKFFDMWKKYYELNDCGRDMPAFCFTVRHFRSFVGVCEKDNEIKLMALKENNYHYIQHNDFSGWNKKFGIPDYNMWSPPLRNKQ